mmetsp:Transcript_50403/g.108636  ORF Transcript_50403/g.108636 Transcript_50403/m.108636 type:complete len:668 (+) Transcript_50403:93-2096(+)
MWARRCGAPPFWPSRVKVLLQSFMTATIGWAVFTYMSSADIGYLDLPSPIGDRPLCLKADTWPSRHSTSSWFSLKTWEEWSEYRHHMAAYVAKNRCPGNTTYDSTTCSLSEVPLHALDSYLGIPMGDQYEWKNDAVEVYGYLFMGFTVLMWLIVMVHDLGLLTNGHKDNVYDFRAIRNRFPCSQRLYELWGFRCWKRLLRGGGIKCGSRRCCEKFSLAIGIIAAPIFVVWLIAVYNIIIVPVAMCFWLVYPVRLSRVLLFLCCLVIGIFGVALSIHSLVWIGDAQSRQAYAVTWESPSSQGPCVCGCAYSLKGGICWNLLIIGVGVAYRSFTLAFRCLKGLRRASWANLMSVLFPVPLAVYEVYWTQPDGGPIRHRVKDQPVQAELAFDAFALMDEQPESGRNTVNLVPSAIYPDFEPMNWKVKDVVGYFQALGLGEYCDVLKEEYIDGPTLLELMRSNLLAEIGIADARDEQLLRERLGTWGARAGYQTGGVSSSLSFKQVSGRQMASPRMMDLQEAPLKHRRKEFIGCCGFPCIAGEFSRYGVVDSDDEQHADEKQQRRTSRKKAAEEKAKQKRDQDSGFTAVQPVEEEVDRFGAERLWIPEERSPTRRQEGKPGATLGQASDNNNSSSSREPSSSSSPKAAPPNPEQATVLGCSLQGENALESL